MAEKIPKSIGSFTIFVFRKMIEKRKFLLFPAWILLAAIALLILVGGTSTLLPAIYIAF